MASCHVDQEWCNTHSSQDAGVCEKRLAELEAVATQLAESVRFLADELTSSSTIAANKHVSALVRARQALDAWEKVKPK